MQACVLGTLAAAGLGLAILPTAAAVNPKFASSPKFVKPNLDAIPKGTRVDVLADKLTYDSRTKIATALGTVRLTYGPYILTATRVVYDMKRGIFKANGSIVLREPNGNVLEADLAEIDDKFAKGFAEHVRALLTNDVTITASYARRVENGITIYEHATYTACKDCADDNGVPLWRIVTGEATHDMKDHTITYKDATLEISGVPVMWSPYFAYPDPTVKRRSGFLLPSFHGGDYGIGVTTPYFWAIAPDKDLTILPTWTTKQGPLLEAEWRQKMASGQYSARASGIREMNPGDIASDDGPWRGAVSSKGDFRINKTWSWGWDGTLSSDRTFLNDYDINNSDMITSRVQVTGLEDRNYAKAELLHFQTALENENQDALPDALPYVTANYVFGQPVLGGELAFDFNAYSLRREDTVNNPGIGELLGTEQSHITTAMSWRSPVTTGWGMLLTPFAEMRGDMYISENVPGAPAGSQSDGYLLPSAGFDMRWPFVADHGIAQGVLTPVFQMIAAPDEPQLDSAANEDAITLNFDTTSLFLSDRFTGYDRYEGGVRANAGLSYTLLGGNGGFLRTSFGESFHLAGNNSFVAGSGLDGTASDLVGAVALQLNENVAFGYQTRVEEDLSRINVQEASLSLTLDRISGSLSYADIAAAADYGRPVRERQFWGDAKYMLGEAWNLYGSFRYDIETSRFMEKTVGIGFACDCMNAHLAYSQSLADTGGTEQKIELGVELRTIGGVEGGFSF
jgi:LPS-assembly protein